jgi:hypothetical protein
MYFLSNGNRTAVTTYKSVAHFLTFQLLYTISGTNCVKRKMHYIWADPEADVNGIGMAFML